MKETGKKSIQDIIKPNVERTILSICLQNKDSIIDVKGKEITGDMFLIDANKYIFYAIDYLYSKKQEPTPVVILEILADKTAKKAVEEFGGIEYLSILQSQRNSINSLDIMCDKLKQSYTRYKTYEILEDNKSRLLSDDMETLNAEEIITSITHPLEDLSMTIQQTKEVYKMGRDADEILELRAENPNSVPGLEVGWSTVDYYTNGGVAGDLIMVCAKAKTGKSSLLTNWATNLSIKDGIPVLYIDTEMNAREQEDRILSRLSNIPHKEIVSGMYTQDTENGYAKDKLKRLRGAVQQIKAGNYFHIYMPTFTIESVTAVAKKFKQQENIQALFMDYLKMPASQAKNLKNMQEWQALGFIASGLKDLAGTLEIPIWSACQENRIGSDDGKKSEVNVGGSYRILQLASKLMFLTNKTEEETLKHGEQNGNQTLYIAFQRNGESDVPPINVMFDRPNCYLKEI